MSYLERLLDGEEVEWLPLGDVIKSLKTGLNPRKNFQLNTPDAECYYVTVREIQNGNITFLDKTDRVNSTALNLINNRSNLEAGDVLFSGTGTVGRTAVIEKKPENWNIKEGVYTIKPTHEIIDSKYLAHLLNSQEIVREYSSKVVGSPVVSLPMSQLKKLQIPIPCPANPAKSLAIQAEIVRILDAFTALTTELNTELTTELTARKKQYNYYRDQLLTFDDDAEVAWKPLGDMVELKRGKRLVKSQLEETGSHAVYQNSMKPLGYYHKSNVNPNTTFIICAGAAGEVGYSDVAFWAADDVYICLNPEDILSKFLFYCLLNQKNKILAQVRRASIPRLSKMSVEKLIIPIPPLAEQARIVAILDKFDALTNSITEGLPHEIKLRQKQYEYYRDLLLSFPNDNK